MMGLGTAECVGNMGNDMVGLGGLGHAMGIRGGARNFCLGGPSCNTNIFIKITPYTHINTHVFFIIYTHFFI